METNKLLTLEEIEKMEASVDSFDAKTKAFFARKGVTLNALLATARAYLELMDKLKKNIPMLRQWLNEDRKASPLVHSHDIAQWLEVPMEFKGYMSIADEQKIIDAVKPEDKPHLPTLKVIEGYNEEKNIIARGCPTMSEYKRREAAGRLREIDKAISAVLVKPLEKHLE